MTTFFRVRLRWIANERAIVALFFAAAAILRFIDLGKAQFWGDEAFTARLASLPLPNMLTAAAGDVHPPLYYLVVWPLVQLFGASPWLVRLPSALASILALLVAARLADELGFRGAVKWAALAFMAFSPFQIYYAQEARHYALLQLLVLTWLLLVLQRRWKLAALVGVATIYTHNYALFYGACIALVGLLRELPRLAILDVFDQATWPQHKPDYKGWALACLAPFLAWLPWELVLMSQMGAISAGYWIQPVTPGSIVYDLYMIWWGYALPEKVQVIGALLTIGLILFGMLKGEKRLVPLIMGFGTLALAVTASILWQPLVLFRGLIASSFPLMLLAASAWAKTKTHLVYAALIVLPLLGPGVVNHYLTNPGGKSGTVEFTNLAALYWQPGDLVVHVNDATAVTWSVYGQQFNQVLAPTCGRNLGQLTPQTRQAMGIQQADPATIPHTRLWVVWSGGPTSPQCESDLVQQLTGGAAPFSVLRNDDLMMHAMWLIER